MIKRIEEMIEKYNKMSEFNKKEYELHGRSYEQCIARKIIYKETLSDLKELKKLAEEGICK